MADQQDNGTENGSPLTRPGFLVAGVLVLVLVLLGAVLAFRVARNDDTTAPPPASPTGVESPSATESTPSADPRASVCGLQGSVGSGTLTSAPTGVWQYEETTAYPTSPEFGPGKTADAGYRYCFQHTPSGAVFATANALAQGTSTDVAKIESWAQYFVSKGTGRQKVLDELNEPRGDSTGIRMSIVGFKVLSYSAQSARIDLAVQTSGSAQTVFASTVYELAWQDGDWKLNSDVAAPFNFASIPGLDGYVPWKA